MQVRITQGIHSLTLLTICLPRSVTLALLCLSWLSLLTNLYHRDRCHYFVVSAPIHRRPCIFISFLTARPTLTSRSPSLDLLPWPGPLGSYACPPCPVSPPFSSIRLSHSPHACPSGLFPPSFLSPLSSSVHPLTLPARISPRRLACAFVSLIFFLLVSPFASGLPISSKMYGHF